MTWKPWKYFGRKSAYGKIKFSEKDILNPSEAIEYFVLSRRNLYDLLNDTDEKSFKHTTENVLILRVAFERYLHNHQN